MHYYCYLSYLAKYSHFRLLLISSSPEVTSGNLACEAITQSGIHLNHTVELPNKCIFHLKPCITKRRKYIEDVKIITV